MWGYDAKQLFEFFRQIPDYVFAKDKNECFIACNENFAKFAGETMESLIGKSEHEMPWKEYADHFIQDDQRMIKTGEPLVNYRETKPNDNGRHEILTNKFPFRNEQGEIIGVIGVFFIVETIVD